MSSVTRWLADVNLNGRARRLADEAGVEARSAVVFEMTDATYQQFEEFKRQAAAAGIPLVRLADRKV